MPPDIHFISAYHTIALCSRALKAGSYQQAVANQVGGQRNIREQKRWMRIECSAAAFISLMA